MPAKPLEIVPFDRPTEPPPGELDEPLIGAREVARMLGISKDKVFQMAYAGELPYYRFGRLVRFSRSAILRSIQHHHQGGSHGQAAKAVGRRGEFLSET